MGHTVKDLTPNAKVTRNTERGNLDIHFADAATLSAPIVSDEWTFGGRKIGFAQLPPNGSLSLDQGAGKIFVKVVTGALASPKRLPFCAPQAIQNTQVTGGSITAGADGALLAILTETDAAPATISDMEQLGFSGPQAEVLKWQTFEQLYGAFMDYFNGMDCYIGPGFHLVDASGTEITYINIWTAGKGVDMSTHNHAQDPSPQFPAFAETHWTIANGTGQGGMYLTPEPGAAERTRFPVQAGEEHGPFFNFDAASGDPTLLANGAVSYPWHGWEAGTDDKPGKAYDVIAAFETAPQFVRVVE